MFDRLKDITVVLGTDRKYLPQLETSWRTWKLFQPWLWEVPWVLFYDNSVTRGELQELLATMGKEALLVEWPVDCRTQYENQRHKMLSGFAFVPSFTVETRYWLKIDNDAICTGPATFPVAHWFDDDPAIIGSPWSYTKPQNQMAVLDSWADGVAGLKEFPPLNLPFDPNAKRCYHPRICSWIFFARTDWTKEVAAYCDGWKLPVPSQDGFHHFCAARRGDKIVRAGMKRHGWTNISRLHELKAKVAEILSCQEPCKMP